MKYFVCVKEKAYLCANMWAYAAKKSSATESLLY